MQYKSRKQSQKIQQLKLVPEGHTTPRPHQVELKGQIL